MKTKIAEYKKEERLLVVEDGRTWDKMSQVVTWSTTYYMKLPDRFEGSLHLLADGVETAEDAHELHQLLQVLRTRNFVIAVDDEEEIIEGTTARAMFVAALKEQEGYAARALRERLADAGENW